MTAIRKAFRILSGFEQLRSDSNWDIISKLFPFRHVRQEVSWYGHPIVVGI